MVQSLHYFCNTLIHRGKILESAVRKYFPNLTELTKKLGYESRNTVYRHFETDDLDDGIILRYARAMNYNFRDEFPDLYKTMVLEEPALKYLDKKTPAALEAQVELLRDMLMESQTEVIRLQKELLEERAKKK